MDQRDGYTTEIEVIVRTRRNGKPTGKVGHTKATTTCYAGERERATMAVEMQINAEHCMTAHNATPQEPK